MSIPDFFTFEFPLPDPEVQESEFSCIGIGSCWGEIFTINKEGIVLRRSKTGPYPVSEFNLTGELSFGTSKNGQSYEYAGYFVNGQLQSLRRLPVVILFDSETNSPEGSHRFYCEQLNNNRTDYRITQFGDLIIFTDSKWGYYKYHGKLHLSLRGYGKDDKKYVAHFDHGKLQSVERVQDGQDSN